MYVAVFGLIVGGFGAYTIHFSVHRSMEAALLTFVLIGGLGLLLGSLTRFDSAALIVVHPGDDSPAVGRVAERAAEWQPSLLSRGSREGAVSRFSNSTSFAIICTPVQHSMALQLWHVLGYGGVARSSMPPLAALAMTAPQAPYTGLLDSVIPPESVVRTTLANGLRLLVRHDTSASRRDRDVLSRLLR